MRHLRWGWAVAVAAVLVLGCAQEEGPLSDGGGALELTSENFQDVLQSTGPVLVDCWATWCGPCRQMAPLVEHLAEEYRGWATVGKLDVDKNPAIAASLRIRAVPTFVVFKNGREVGRIVGGRSKAELASALERNL